MGNSPSKTEDMLPTSQEPNFILQRLKTNTAATILDTIIVKYIGGQEFQINYRLIGERRAGEPVRINTLVRMNSTQALRKYFECSVKNLMTAGGPIQICPVPGPIMTIQNTDESKLKQAIHEQLTLWFISHSIMESSTTTENPTAPFVDVYTK